MTKSLPQKLKKEPLIDAIFEVRFDSDAQVSVVLPGMLFRELEGNKSINRLPVSEIPQDMRRADPNLKYAPLSRIEWGSFFVNIGDCSLSISCKYPYSGWKAFKPAIIKVIKGLESSGLAKHIERYSMKYVDLVPTADNREKVSMVNLDVTIAGHKLEKEPYQIRVEIPRGGLLNIVNIVSSAKATLHTGISKEGLIVEVDTIVMLNSESISALVNDFPNKLEAIHLTNKTVFFDCITPTTLDSLEPVYE